MSDDNVPKWVPHVAPGLQADVYPVSPPPANRSSSQPSSPPAELRLDRHAVVHGFSERRLPFEFASYVPPDRALPASSASEEPTPSFSATDFAKLREGLTELRRAPPTAPQRVNLNNLNSPRRARNSLSPSTAFPIQKPSTSVSLDDWFAKLSPSSAVSTSVLSRSIPLGPAIARAANKIIEMMSSCAVPSQRAVWYIRIAVLNECLKQNRPDRPSPSPRDSWTRQLVALLRSDTDSIRARKAAHPESADRVTFWRYLLDVVRWQADENLLDLPMWLNCIAEILKIELVNAQTFTAPGTTIAIMATRRFLHEFIVDVENARLLCKVLLPGADIVVKLWRASCQVPKGGKPVSRKLPKRNFVPNSCHAEMTFLLSAALQVLDPDSVHTGPELRVSDMERFVIRGFEIVSDSSANQKLPKVRLSSEKLQLAPVHHVMRELEMLSAHGDIRRIIAVVQSSAQDGVGSISGVVNTVCKWALVGPVSDHAEAISIASAVLTYLSTSLKTTPHSALPDSKLTSHGDSTLQGQSVVFQPSGIPAGATPHNPSHAPAAEPILQRDLWAFLKEFSKSRGVASLEKEDYIVRFIAQICRLGLLSLHLFVRDVSRLTSCDHPGSAFLVKCLSLLPDPSDRSDADCRRSLLRKYGYASTSRRNYTHGIENNVLVAARSGNMSNMDSQAESLIASENTNVILSTSEAVRLTTISQLLEDPGTFEKKLFTMITFLLNVDEPGMAVEWLLDNLSQVIENDVWNEDSKINVREKVVLNLVRLAGDLSRYIAACGHLDTVLNLFLKAYQSPWITLHVRSVILHTLSSYACTFGAASMNGSMYWTELVIRKLSQMAKLSKSVDFIPFACASLRGRLPSEGDGESLSDFLNVGNKSNWGVTSDEDLGLTWNLRDCKGIEVTRLREHFYNNQVTFPVESLFLKGLSANDLMGCVFIPVLSDALSESNVGTALSPFSDLAKSVLHIVESRQNDVRMQGLRHTLVIDFMALIIAGCVCIHVDPSESLDVLSRMRWIWKILAPRAGIELARRLWSQVDSYCGKTATTDKSEVAAMMSSMVARLYGETVRDEIAVSSSIGTEPFGMIELQLALFAINRRECGEEDEFGTNVSEASYADEDCAHSLTVTALECCAYNDEYRRAMAGIMAFSAAQAMVESLNYVVTGLTMEMSKSTAIHQERARQWYDADRARRKALELCVSGVNEQVGDQVEAMMFEQLESAGKHLITAMSNGSLPSDILMGGQKISDALESRLRSILQSKRTKQSPEIWRRRSLEVAQFLKASVPLLRHRTIQTCLNVLDMCIKSVDRSHSGGTVGEMEEIYGDGTRGVRPENISSDVEGDVEAVSLAGARKLLQQESNTDLRKQLGELLAPVMLWVEAAEKEALQTLIGNDIGSKLKALNEEGAEIDTWKLLEGYGRGPDEVAAVPPSSFWRQECDRSADREQGRAVLLKRTYTTFSGLVA